MNKLETQLGSILRVPVQLTNGMRRFVGSAVSDSVELVLPSKTAGMQVKEMKMLQPLHDANLGARTLERGNRTSQDELIVFGGLMIVRAALRAESSRAVPDGVTRRVCYIADEQDALPAVEGYLPTEMKEPATDLIEKYLRYDQNVVDLFSPAAR